MSKIFSLIISLFFFNLGISFGQEDSDLEALEAELLGINNKEEQKQSLELERRRSRELFHDALITIQAQDFESALVKFDTSLQHGLKHFPKGHHLPQIAYAMKAWAYINLYRMEDADEILTDALHGFQRLDYSLVSNETYSPSHFYYEKPYEYYFGVNKEALISAYYIYSKTSQGQYREAQVQFEKVYNDRKEKVKNGLATWDQIDLEFFQSSIPVLCTNYELDLANELVDRSEELIATLNIEKSAPVLMSRSKINEVVVLKTSGEFKQAESIIVELLKTESLTKDEFIMLQLYYTDILLSTNQHIRAEEILDKVKKELTNYPPYHSLKLKHAFLDIAKYEKLAFWPEEIDNMVENKLSSIITHLDSVNQSSRAEYWEAVYLLFNYFDNRISSNWSQFKYTGLLDKILKNPNAPPSIQSIAYIRKAIQLKHDEEYTAAMQYALKSLELAQRTGNPIELTSIHTILANLSTLLNENTEAYRYYELVHKDVMSLISNYNYYLNESNREKFWKSHIATPLAYYKSYCVDNYNKDLPLLDSLINLRINTKGALLKAGQYLNNRVRNSNDPKVHELHAQLIELKNQYSLLMNEPYSEKRIVISNKLSLAETDIAHLLEVDNVEAYLDWKEIRNVLTDNQTAIEIIRIQEDDQVRYVYIALSNKSKNPSIAVLELNENEEMKLLKTYENLIKFNIESELIYQELFEPFLRNIPDGSEMILSVDGIYNKINPNTLKKGNTYMIDKFKFLNVTSLRSIYEQSIEKKEANSNDVYLFGRPEYYKKDSTLKNKNDRSRSNRWYADESFADLPGTQIEVESISSLLANSNINSVIHLGKEANEKSIKELDNPYILHLATHGYFIDSEEHSNYLPMMNSGLVMANAGNNLRDPNTENDGFLTAFELSSLNLSNTELTIFSACESGLGEVKNGEGVYGLGRALQLAGSKFSILSLWKVDDEATKDLMITLYKNIIETQNIKQSFHDAQLITREKYPAPRDWGAFTLIEN